MTYPQPPAPEAGLAPVAGVISGPALPRPGEIDRARRMLDGEGLAPPEAVAAALLARTVEAVRLWSSA